MAKRTQEAQVSQAAEAEMKGPFGLDELIQPDFRAATHTLPPAARN